MSRLPNCALALVIICVLPQAALGVSGRYTEATAIQASVSDQGLALLSSPGRAKVISGPKGLRKIKVRRNEQLVVVEQTARGLVAAGVRKRDDESRLVLVEADRGGKRRLPVPRQREALRLRPVLLIDDGNLAGAAWLEGPDLRHLRVRAADWDGTRWSSVATISSPSSGSQTGLTGSILRDGTILLVWSQFDGTDDEIFFSWRQSAEWSAPRRLSADNKYPDVAPSVTFSGSGALAAWSRFNGSTYRVWTARFDHGEWREESIRGEPGSLFPRLLHRNDFLYLLSRSSMPRGWSIRQTTAAGRSERISFVAAEDSSPPVLAATAEASVTLAWPQKGRQEQVRLELVP